MAISHSLAIFSTSARQTCVCVCACVLDTTVSPAKTAELIEIIIIIILLPFGGGSRLLWAERNHVLDEGVRCITWLIRLNDPRSVAMRPVATVTAAT